MKVFYFKNSLSFNLTKLKSLSRNFYPNSVDLRAYFWIYLFVSFFSEQSFTIINFCQIKFNNRNKLNYKETVTTSITLSWCFSWSDFKLFANHVVEFECVFVEISVMKRHLVTMLWKHVVKAIAFHWSEFERPAERRSLFFGCLVYVHDISF